MKLDFRGGYYSMLDWVVGERNLGIELGDVIFTGDYKAMEEHPCH
jgi:hypothetical protein